MDQLIVFLDANMLYPAALRDLFMCLALQGFFVPNSRTSCMKNGWRQCSGTFPISYACKLERTRDLMNRNAVDSLETDFEYLGWAEPLTLQPFPSGSHLAIGTLLAEIHAPERFASLKHLLSYLGWCPDTKQSDTSVTHYPTIARRGNRFVRRPLDASD
jgi:hypothetical protein